MAGDRASHPSQCPFTCQRTARPIWDKGMNPPATQACPMTASGLVWAHLGNIILSWGLEVLRNGGCCGDPQSRETLGTHTTFLGLSKVFGGEPPAGTCLLSTGLKCGQLVLKLRPLWGTRAGVGGREGYKGSPHLGRGGETLVRPALRTTLPQGSSARLRRAVTEPGWAQTRHGQPPCIEWQAWGGDTRALPTAVKGAWVSPAHSGWCGRAWRGEGGKQAGGANQPLGSGFQLSMRSRSRSQQPQTTPVSPQPRAPTR